MSLTQTQVQMQTVGWRDTPHAYGAVSRAFHWSMALLFIWQFTGILIGVVADKTPIADFFGSTHKSIGLVLLILVCLRGLWGLLNLRNRPGHQPTFLGRAATMGHAALYLLMFVVPALAMLRQYGSGRAFAPFGIPLMEGFEEKIPWMMAPANALHGLLGWVLLALIVGHIAMVFVHRFAWNDNVLARMAGR